MKKWMKIVGLVQIVYTCSIMSASGITIGDSTYTLTVNGGIGSGSSYTNQQQIAIEADASASGKVFDRWVGDTQYVASVTSSNTTITMPTTNISLTSTYIDVSYTLTVTSGTGSGSYTNGRQVVISANSISGKVFVQWTGDTQYVASAISSNTTVTMPARAVALTATYKILPGYYTLTVNNGTGGGIYSNGTQVAIAAASVLGKAFDRWIGDTQVVASVTSSNAVVTIPARAVTLTATYMEDHTKNLVFYSDFENSDDGQEFFTSADLNNATIAPPSPWPQVGTWVISPYTSVRCRSGAVSQVAYIALAKNALGLSATLAEPVSFTGTEAIRFSYDFQPNSGVKGTAQIITGYDVDNNIVFKIKMNSIAGSPQYWVWVNDLAIGVANRSGNSANPLNSISLTLDATGITATLFNPSTLETNTVSGIPAGGGSALNRFTLVSELKLASNFDYDNFQVWAISPGCTLRVNSGTGDGVYANGTQVAISADVVSGQAFDRWIGDTQYVDSVTSSTTTVTMPTNPVNLTATYVKDHGKPVLKITAPTDELKVFATNGLFIVQGTASDNKVVTNVLVQFNDGVWTSASTTNGWKNWSLPVELMPGKNTIRAYCMDSAMNRSLGKMVKCTYLQGAIIQVQVNGDGKVKPDYNGQMLEIGKRYQIGAKGIKNTSVFTDWTQGIGGPVITTKREFTFVMQSDLVLTANFSSLLTRRAALVDMAVVTPSTTQAAIVVDGLVEDWANVPPSSFSYASVTQEVAVALDGNNIALLLNGCPFNTSDNVLVYFKLRLSYGDGDNRHSVDLWTSGSVLYGMVDGQVIAGLEAVLLNGVLEVKLPVEQVPSQVTIEEIGCGMDLGTGTLTELFRISPAEQ